MLKFLKCSEQQANPCVSTLRYSETVLNRFGYVKNYLIFAFLWGACAANAQTDTVPRSGAWAVMEVIRGDTTFLMTLRTVYIGARREFKDQQERMQYFRYVRAARKVYPYALKAVTLYNEIQEETKDMSKRQRRRVLRKEKNELKEDYYDHLKEFTKTEGHVLVKMIERQTGKPMFNIIKETRGGLTASYWHNLGKVWGYNLKDGYFIGQDPLLDDVLIEYDFGEALLKY